MTERKLLIRIVKTFTNLPHHRGPETAVEAAKSLLREYQFGRSQRRTGEAAVRRCLHARLDDFSGHPDQACSLTRGPTVMRRSTRNRS